VISEFKKLKNIEVNSVIYFWFEDDFFVNSIRFLFSEVKKDLKLFRVFPKEDSWEGFANLKSNDFESRINNAIEISEEDVALAKRLWSAFSENDLEELKRLSHETSKVLRKRDLIIHAIKHLKSGKTKSELKELSKKIENFNSFFNEITLKYGIFGLGDLQVKNLIK